MDKPTVSILMPVYNAEKYLAETIESVLAQTFQDWEIILMDGQSKDGTLDIAQQYAATHPNIQIFSEPDEGVYHAIHKAFQRSRGNFICLLCASDKYLDIEWLRKCADVVTQDPEISLVWGVPFDMREDGTIIGPHFAYAHFLAESPQRKKFFKEIVRRLTHPSSLIRLLKKVNTSNLNAARRTLKKGPPPQKQAWFTYWLSTGTIFPDGNMFVSRKAFEECLAPYHPGTREAGDWMSFFFDINAKGYLSYCIPVGANATRSQQAGSVTSKVLTYNDAKRRDYFKKLALLRKQLSQHAQQIIFRDRAGNMVS